MLVRFEIAARQPVLGGKSFGTVGSYEQLKGSAFFELDPGHPRNEPIVDLERATTTSSGGVECRADIWLLQPVDPDRGNGNLFYYVLNRGRKGALSTFNLAQGSNAPISAEEFGDGLLMEQGYTVAACAWQADVPPEAEDNPNLMTLDAPVAHGVQGLVGCEILVDAPVAVHSLGSRYHRPYALAEGTESEAWLSVREAPYGPAEPIPREEWEFTQLDDGRPAIHYTAGFVPGLIYNLVYTGKDPQIMGVGLATTRDFVSCLKGNGGDPRLWDERPALARAYGFGSSQSGRFLRHFLYQGFNEDEEGRQVFDGLLPNVAGAGRGSFNHRFAQPSRHSSAHFDVFYPTEQFPFGDAPAEDSLTGASGGLLDICGQQRTMPKIFYVNSSTEYWNRSASLTHVDIDGSQDLTLPPEVRIYHFAGTQHGAAEIPTGPNPLPGNPVEFRLGLRALLQDLDEWVRLGVDPPPSSYGRVSDETLVDPAALEFPALPGLSPPRVHRRPCRLDFGPAWDRGIIDVEPPGLGTEYPVLVPAVDADGNELAGIRLPEVAVPLGTFVGWRLRTEAMGAPWAMVGLQGVWLPFAPDLDLVDEGDPRPVIATRYRDRDDYIHRAEEVARALIDRRLLLARDLQRVAERAGQMYDWTIAKENQA